MELERLQDAFGVENRLSPDNLVPPDQDLLFTNLHDLYTTIDAAHLGHIPWHSVKLSYQAAEGEDISNIPWKSKTFKVWYQDPQEVLKIQLSNCNFANEMDFMVKKVFNPKTKQCCYQDFMLGEWAWELSVVMIQPSIL